jgi:hypothetical protein
LALQLKIVGLASGFFLLSIIFSHHSSAQPQRLPPNKGLFISDAFIRGILFFPGNCRSGGDFAPSPETDRAEAVLAITL